MAYNFLPPAQHSITYSTGSGNSSQEAAQKVNFSPSSSHIIMMCRKEGTSPSEMCLWFDHS